MTGIRSWTAEVTAFGVVVRIEQVSTAMPPPCQRSQMPANANNSPSLTSNQNGCFVFPARDHSSSPPVKFAFGARPRLLEKLRTGIQAAFARTCGQRFFARDFRGNLS